MTTNRVTKKASVDRADGLKFEAVVINWLKERNPVVNPSLPHENIQQDIDCHVRNKHGHWSSVSIKVNNPEYATKPFLFELQQAYYQVDDNGELLTDLEPNVRNSWFYKGRAQYYLIWKRDTKSTGKLWLIEKSALKQYVDEHGFDRSTCQRDDVRRREVAEGKAWTSLGLIEMDKLIDAKIARHIGDIT